MELKILKSFWIVELISSNIIGTDGAAKLGEGVSKLINLISLNLKFE